MVTDESSSRVRTSAIHKEKFNVRLSGNESIDLSNTVKHLKTFTVLAEMTNSRGLREKPEVMIVVSFSLIILSYFFAGTFKTRVNSKYQSKGAVYTSHLLSFVEIRIFNAFFRERKTGFGIVMKNCVGCGILVKKEREGGIRTPPPPSPFETLTRE